MVQNTLHPQTARFIASLTTALPELNKDLMQLWIHNPGLLKATLQKALDPENSGARLVELAGSSSVDGINRVVIEEIFANASELSLGALTISHVSKNFLRLARAVSDADSKNAVFLQAHQLCHAITPPAAWKAMGGLERVLSTPSTLYRALLAHEKHGRGTLFRSHKGTNLWYMRERGDLVWEVFCHWVATGWRIGATLVKEDKLLEDGTYIIG